MWADLSAASRADWKADERVVGLDVHAAESRAEMWVGKTVVLMVE